MNEVSYGKPVKIRTKGVMNEVSYGKPVKIRTKGVMQ